MFRLSSSLTLVAAAFARGARAFCHHVRVRALGAIMCAWQLANLVVAVNRITVLRHRVRFAGVTTARGACRDGRAIRSRPAFHRTLQHATEPNFTFVHGLRRGCSGSFVIVIASLFAAATVAAATVTAAIATSASAQNQNATESVCAM